MRAIIGAALIFFSFCAVLGVLLTITQSWWKEGVLAKKLALWGSRLMRVSTVAVMALAMTVFVASIHI